MTKIPKYHWTLFYDTDEEGRDREARGREALDAGLALGSGWRVRCAPNPSYKRYLLAWLLA